MSLHVHISDPQIEARLAAGARQQGRDINTFTISVIENAVCFLPNIEIENADQESPTLLERYGHLFGTAQAGSGNRAEHPES